MLACLPLLDGIHFTLSRTTIQVTKKRHLYLGKTRPSSVRLKSDLDFLCEYVPDHQGEAKNATRSAKVCWRWPKGDYGWYHIRQTVCCSRVAVLRGRGPLLPDCGIISWSIPVHRFGEWLGGYLGCLRRISYWSQRPKWWAWSKWKQSLYVLLHRNLAHIPRSYLGRNNGKMDVEHCCFPDRGKKWETSSSSEWPSRDYGSGSFSSWACWWDSALPSSSLFVEQGKVETRQTTRHYHFFCGEEKDRCRDGDYLESTSNSVCAMATFLLRKEFFRPWKYYFSQLFFTLCSIRDLYLPSAVLHNEIIGNFLSPQRSPFQVESSRPYFLCIARRQFFSLRALPELDTGFLFLFAKTQWKIIYLHTWGRNFCFRRFPTKQRVEQVSCTALFSATNGGASCHCFAGRKQQQITCVVILAWLIYYYPSFYWRSLSF